MTVPAPADLPTPLTALSPLDGRYAAKLAALRPLVERGDGEALERVFAAARAARERWLQGEYEP